MQHDHALKMSNFDLLIPPQGRVCVCVCVLGGGSAGKVFANMLMHSRFPFI